MHKKTCEWKHEHSSTSRTILPCAFARVSKPWNAVFLLLSTVHFAAEEAPADTLLLITEKGQTLRTRIDTIRETNRYAMGVRLFQVDPSDRIVSASVASTDPDDDTPPADEEAPAESAPADTPPEEAGDANIPPEA